jgi:hypothetical protein
MTITPSGHEHKRSPGGPPRAQPECFRPIAEGGEIRQVAGSRDPEPLSSGIGTFEFRDFTPLIKYGTLLKQVGSM